MRKLELLLFGRSFKRRLIVSYSALLLLTPIVCLILYGAALNYMENELYNYSWELTQLINTGIEAEQHNIEQALFYDKSLIEAIRTYTADISAPELSDVRSQFFRSKLKNSLTLILYNKDFLRYICYIDRQNNLISCGRHNYTRQPYDIEAYISRDMEQLMQKKNKPIWQGCENGDIVLKKLVTDIDTLQIEGYIIYVIDPGYFKSKFISQQEDNRSSFVLMDADGYPLLSGNEKSREISRQFAEQYGQTSLFTKGCKLVYEGTTFYCKALQTNKSGSIGIEIIDLQWINNAQSFFSKMVAAVTVLSTLLASVLAVVFSGKIAKSVKKLLKGIQEIGKGNFSYEIVLDEEDELSIVSKGINDMSKNIEKLMNHLLVEQKLRQEAIYDALEYKYYALRCQINPHLLFNSLETINGVAKLNGDFETSRLICQLAKLLRTTIDRSEKFLPLCEEIEYCRMFLGFYKDIYGDRLKTHFHIDKNVESHPIPSFILVPILENSVVHGVEKSTGECRITVACYQDGQMLVLGVNNDGPVMTDDQIKRIMEGNRKLKKKDGQTSIGLRNIQEKIHMLYDGQAHLSITSAETQGTTVKIKIPLHYDAAGIYGKREEENDEESGDH